MSETTFTIELAKTGRAACKKCKEKIAKDDLRIGKEAPGPGDYTMTSWFHPACFTLPRNLSGMSAEDFVDDLLQDTSDGCVILPERKDEVVAMIDAKPAKKRKSEDGGDPFITKLKREYDSMSAAAADDDAPKKKKAKRDDKNNHSRAVELYGEYHKLTGAALKHLLQMNRQVQSGTKPILLHKVIDGALNGRLARCQICAGGRLKFNDDCTQVVCLGTYDEEMACSVPCSVTYTPEKAPRWQPFFLEEPSEEEKAEMDRLEAVAKGEETAEEANAEVSDDSDLGKLLKEAEGIKLDMSNREAIQESTAKIVELLEANGSLDLPEGLKMKVGQGILQHTDLSAPELIKVFAKDFGFRKAKAEKAKAKESAIEAGCANPANAPLLLVFEEMASLYFKEQNINAGGTYKKVVTALKDVEFEVTVDNAKSLGKAGKNKLTGVGKGSAEKIYEFLSTGKIEKLEELRQNAA